MKAWKHSSPHCGFTLIELLTVIAIIGILSTLVITTVSRVRRQADRVTCTSNLRQVGAAMQLYMNDRKDGRFPGPVYRNQRSSTEAGDAHLSSSKLLLPYLGNHIVERNGIKYVTILECPAWKKVIGSEDDIGSFASFYTNQKARKTDGSEGDVLGYKSTPPTQPMTMQDLAAPSRTWILVDLDAKIKSDSTSISEIAHGNTRNYLFADGHVVSSKTILKNDP